ncbi:MAG: hypothetical protein ACSLEM_01495 [Candidatus Malihini olakiniferum]
MLPLAGTTRAMPASSCDDVLSKFNIDTTYKALEFGIDISVQSDNKYIASYSDDMHGCSYHQCKLLGLAAQNSHAVSGKQPAYCPLAPRGET